MILGISSSQSKINLVLGDNNKVLYQDQLSIITNNNSDIGGMLKKALSILQIEIDSILQIIVDVGPGGTSSVRTGVAFANGLAYSLKVPIGAVTSIELIGIEIFDKLNLPIAVVFPSVKQNYYYGFYDGENINIKYGGIEEIAKTIDEKFSNLVLTGYGNALDLLPNLIKNCNISHSSINKVNPEIMITKNSLFSGRLLEYPNLPVPITELSV